MLDRGEETRGLLDEGWGPWQSGELEEGSFSPQHYYLHFGLDNSLLWEGHRGHYIPGGYPLDASSTHHPVVTTKKVSRHCQISPGSEEYKITPG